MRPTRVPKFIKALAHYTNEEKIALIQEQNKKLLKGAPEVTVVVPAYNEEKEILNTLITMTANVTSRSVEILVVNNNSTDRTKELVDATGVRCIDEFEKGVTAARTSGLKAAKGKYIINADADSLYPPFWVNAMISPLEKSDEIALAYGRFAFLPSGSNSRFVYFLYENVADILRWFKKHFKEEGMNVYGCNSAFRKEHCLAVNAFEHPPGTNEDGWLAVKLRNGGFGKLKYVGGNKATVWTVDRHLQNDGGLLKAFVMRIKNAITGK